MGHMAYWILK